MKWAADFETNNSMTECRVWSWGMCAINELEEFIYGTDLDEFLITVSDFSKEEAQTIYFHNLKFDGEFIVINLLKRGFTLKTSWSEKLQKNSFTTLISDMGQWYAIKVRFLNHTITFIDSLKILPFSVAEIANSFGLDIKKGSIDYDLVRPVGYTPTKEEIDYQENDVRIMAQALKKTFESGDTKMTAGSNAFADFKRRKGKKKFEKLFPVLSELEDTFVRKAYKGGWVYANKNKKGKEIGQGIILDVNSLYPSRLRYELLPYGHGFYHIGKLEKREDTPLFIQHLECSLKLKDGYFPCIQIKNNMAFSPTDYIEDTKGQVVELWLTNVDLSLMLENYEVKDLAYIDGYYYHACRGMFDDYIDFWMNGKVEAENRGDISMRTLAKIKLNSLYGKFAKRPKGASKWPVLNEDGSLSLQLGEIEDQGSIYIPVGAFTTSYARNFTIRSAQLVKDRFLYSDTDSLHLEGTTIPEELKISPVKLGYWKLEGEFTSGKYLGAKAYCEKVKTKEEKLIKYLREKPECYHHVNWNEKTLLKITCAGMPDKVKNQVTFDNFNVGLKVQGKLKPKHVPGGVMLTKIPFEIRKRA